MKLILFTAWNKSVSVNYPSQTIFEIISRGGLWRGFERGFVQRQIEKQIESGIDPDHARRWVDAVQYGGLTTSEIYELVKDRDCARFGKDHRLIHPSELPERWFRDAWRRGDNSGDLYVDLELARQIQFKKIKQHNKKGVKLDLPTIRSAIRNARDTEELKRVWPQSCSPQSQVASSIVSEADGSQTSPVH